MALESIRPYVQLASGLGEMTKAKAMDAAMGLLSVPGVGEAGRAAVQVSAIADDLLAAARSNRDALVSLIRSEVESAIGRSDLARRADLDAARGALSAVSKDLEELRTTLIGTAVGTAARGMAVADGVLGRSPAPSAPPSPRPSAAVSTSRPAAPAGTTTAKRSTARKAAPAKTATAKKSTAKKSTAKKSTAKKSTAKKSTAKKSTAKKATATTAAPAKKTSARRTTARESTARKSTAQNSTAQKSTAQKATASKATATKAGPAKKTSARKTTA